MTALSIVADPSAPPPAAHVRSAFSRLAQGFRAEPYPSARAREDRLLRLARMLQQHVEPLVDAMDRDFRGRARAESLAIDLTLTLETIRHAKKHLRSWMRPRRVEPAWFCRPSSARVELQPRGVVAVLSPWNLPVLLAIAPLAEALAAGNRVLLKPSEMTPHTSELLARLLAETFAGDEVQVVLGGPDVARAVTELPLDHIVFTGSTRVGREVAQAAAKNLVPATLELGGKSPVLIHEDYDITHAAERVAFGKLVNAGQVCLAPDYVLVPAGKEETFIESFRAWVAKHYGDLKKSADYTAILSERHRAHLESMVEDAARRGARVVRIDPFGTLGGRQPKMPPALVLDPPPDCALMQHEIFGPVLPVIPVRSTEEAIAFVNERPRPLALYLFDDDQHRAQDVLRRTHSGGVCLNDTILHFVQPDLPFGGVGASGYGSYHGIEGFRSFSHQKSVLSAHGWSGVGWAQPPYPAFLVDALRKLIGG